MDNQTKTNITNIEVEYPGGSFGLPYVAAGRSRKRWIKPTGTGAIKIHFFDDSGDHRLTLPAIKPGDKGTTQIVFFGSGRTAVNQLPTH